MLRSFVAFVALLFMASTATAQTPATADFHMPSAFDNSYAGTLPQSGVMRSMGEDRYGFQAIFEWRVAPGVVKVFDVRQYFGTEQGAIQGFMRVQSSMPQGTSLVNVEWFSPTTGGSEIGN